MKDIPKEVVFILLAVYAVILVIQSYVFLDYATTGYATTGSGNVGLCIGPRTQFDSVVCPNNITAGYLYFCEVIASADDGSSIIYTNNPTSLFSIGRTTGIIVFSSTLNQIGAYTITITATGGTTSCEGSSVSTSIDIDVTKPICGNAIVELGESCDQGADNGIGWCSAICTIQQNNRESGGGSRGGGGGGGGGGGQEADQGEPQNIGDPSQIISALTQLAEAAMQKNGKSQEGPQGQNGQTDIGTGKAESTVPIGAAYGAFDNIVNAKVISNVTVGALLIGIILTLLTAFMFKHLQESIILPEKKESSINELASINLERVQAIIKEIYKSRDREDVESARKSYVNLRKLYSKLDKKEQAVVYNEIINLYKEIEEMVKNR